MGFNCCDGGAVCGLDVSPGDNINHEGDEGCADAPPAGIGLAVEPRPKFHPDVGGTHEKDQTFEDDIPPVERIALLHSLRQRFYHEGKPQPARIRFELLNDMADDNALDLIRS